MDLLNAELHCHNSFSNFHQSRNDTPYDCGVSVRDQLERALQAGLDCIFVTNHNTLDGYTQMRAFQQDHPKYARIRVFPAEEITTNDGAHVIAYGLHEEIRPRMSFEETLDEIRSQDAVSMAPHPFSLLDALREKAASCDLIEVFNSNNIDLIANAKATLFAEERGMTGVSGSDSHVASTIGRCINVVESEEGLDEMIDALRRGKVGIKTTGYATIQETMEHFRYKVSNSTDYIHEYVSEFYPHSRKLFLLLLKIFEHSPRSYLWTVLFRIGLLAMRRISRKINHQDLDPSFMRERDLMTMFRAAL